jgi:hypothetical protein
MQTRFENSVADENNEHSRQHGEGQGGRRREEHEYAASHADLPQEVGRIRGIIFEDIRAALDRGDNRHAAEPVSAWRHFLEPTLLRRQRAGTDHAAAPER